jgi:hypothetical protein
MDGRKIPSYGGIVHYIIVDQRKIVEYLYTGSRHHGLIDFIGEEIARHQCQDGAQTFASNGYGIFHWLKKLVAAAIVGVTDKSFVHYLLKLISIVHFVSDS